MASLGRKLDWQRIENFPDEKEAGSSHNVRQTFLPMKPKSGPIPGINGDRVRDDNKRSVPTKATRAV